MRYTVLTSFAPVFGVGFGEDHDSQPIALAPKDILAVWDVRLGWLQQGFFEKLHGDVVVQYLRLGMPTDRDIPQPDDVSVEVVHDRVTGFRAAR